MVTSKFIDVRETKGTVTEPETPQRLAVLVSGSGTLLEAMLEAEVPIRLVLADRECRGIEIAKQYREDNDLDMEIVVINRRDYGFGNDPQWDRASFSSDIAGWLNVFDIDVAAMAGFMTILDPIIFERFDGWVLNIHPSLLPAFPGEHAVRDALTAGVTETGTTIHIATDTLDDATYTIAQRRVKVQPGDDEATLHERIKRSERQLYVDTLRRILDGRLQLHDVPAAA